MVEYTDAEGKKRYKTEKTDRDGSKAGKRRHWGFIAQDVEQIGQDLNIDIAAFTHNTFTVSFYKAIGGDADDVYFVYIIK